MTDARILSWIKGILDTQTRKAISGRLKQARQIAGLKFEPAAERVGTDHGSIHHWENGRLPRIDALYRLAKAYGRSMEWFITGEDSMSEALGEEPTDLQLRAATVAGAMPAAFADEWLESGEGLLELLRSSETLLRVAEEMPEYRARRRSQ